MKINTLLGISSLIASGIFSPLATSQSLQQAVQQTINENPEIQAEKSERLAIEHQISKLNRAIFLQLTFLLA